MLFARLNKLANIAEQDPVTPELSTSQIASLLGSPAQSLTSLAALGLGGSTTAAGIESLADLRRIREFRGKDNVNSLVSLQSGEVKVRPEVVRALAKKIQAGDLIITTDPYEASDAISRQQRFFVGDAAHHIQIALPDAEGKLRGVIPGGTLTKDVPHKLRSPFLSAIGRSFEKGRFKLLTADGWRPSNLLSTIKNDLNIIDKAKRLSTRAHGVTVEDLSPTALDELGNRALSPTEIGDLDKHLWDTLEGGGKVRVVRPGGGTPLSPEELGKIRSGWLNASRRVFSDSADAVEAVLTRFGAPRALSGIIAGRHPATCADGVCRAFQGTRGFRGKGFLPQDFLYTNNNQVIADYGHRNRYLDPVTATRRSGWADDVARSIKRTGVARGLVGLPLLAAGSYGLYDAVRDIPDHANTVASISNRIRGNTPISPHVAAISKNIAGQ